MIDVPKLTRLFIAVCLLSALFEVDAADDTRIAFRYDDSHVIFVLGRQGPFLVDSRSGSKPLPPPAATLSRLSLFEPNDKSASRVTELADKVVVGSQFWLLTGRQKTVPVTVDQILPSQLACDGAAVAVASIAAGEQEAFARVREKYYLLRQQHPGASSAANLGLDWSAIEPAKNLTIRDRMHELLQKELSSGDYLKNLNYTRATKNQATHWKMLDANLLAGNATMHTTVQQLHLSAEHEPLYYVRARWEVAGSSAFLMTAFLRSAQASVIQTDASVSSWLRMGIFRHTNLGARNMGLILNVFDHDRNGKGEFLFSRQGYEGGSIVLQEYSGTDLVATGIEHRYGC